VVYAIPIQQFGLVLAIPCLANFYGLFFLLQLNFSFSPLSSLVSRFSPLLTYLDMVLTSRPPFYPLPFPYGSKMVEKQAGLPTGFEVLSLESTLTVHSVCACLTLAVQYAAAIDWCVTGVCSPSKRIPLQRTQPLPFDATLAGRL
jgi:hypothetical protein